VFRLKTEGLPASGGAKVYLPLAAPKFTCLWQRQSLPASGSAKGDQGDQGRPGATRAEEFQSVAGVT